MWFYISSHSVTKWKGYAKYRSHYFCRTLVEDDVVGALKAFLSSSCCYNKNITKHVKAKEIIPSNGHQVLETKFRSSVKCQNFFELAFCNIYEYYIQISISCIFSQIDLLSGPFPSNLVLLNCMDLTDLLTLIHFNPMIHFYIP